MPPFVRSAIKRPLPKKKELEILQGLADEGALDLYYFDESSFSLQPNIPYGWQKKGETIELESTRSPSLNALGFLTKENTLVPYLIEGSVDRFVVVEVFEDFLSPLDSTRRKVIVIDNAPAHTSEFFQLHEEHWKEKYNAELFPLPTYSPELNIIEILWRFVKYQWLPWEAYQSIEKLLEERWNVFLHVGDDFIISFG